MANLLITLLAIGMGAAFLAAAVNYGGTAYYEARSEARATELIASAAKVSSALVSWSRANNGSRTLTETATKSCTSSRAACWETGVAGLDLVNGSNAYLDRVPRLDSYAQGNGSTDYFFKTMPKANVAWTAEGTGFDSLFAVITDNAVCNAIARISRGPSAMPRTRNVSGSTMGDFTAALSNSTFDCIINDANNNSVWDSGESMFFIYRVF